MKNKEIFEQNRGIYDIYDQIDYSENLDKGLNEDIIKEISKSKQEPEWLLQYRLKAFQIFKEKKNPDWGPDLSEVDLTKLILYIKPDVEKEKSWENLPEYIVNTFDRLRNT